jgi:hypothetical protein
MRRLGVLTVLMLATSSVAFAESYRDGRIRHIEEGVSIQRATETGSEEAAANLPFLPGDRVWTDGSGRAEFQFAGGSILRLDRASKLDYVAREDGRDERIVLRMWSGAIYLHLRDRRDGPFEIETPGGIVTSDARGVLRIDVESGETRLSVYEGEATLEAGQSVRVRAGERVYAQRGEVGEGPTSFDRGEGDEFAEWDGGREEQTAYAANQSQPLPEDVAPYEGELDRHGAWYYETEVGHVWRPYVGAGWQPYSNGRWVWTVFGWTWVPYESWGWATSHYGRWGFSGALGWYWIPGATWSPAWVSWASGGNYVGWCPLGYRDRPVLVYDRLGRGTNGASGFSIPRGVATVASPWTYLRRGDMGSHDVLRRRVTLDAGAVQQVRVLETPQARLTRNLAVTEAPPPVARAVPRDASRRPGMADTVPEMRGDAMTTIGVARHRGRTMPAGTEREAPGEAAPGNASAAPAGAPVRYRGAFGQTEASDHPSTTPATPLPPVGTPRGAHPTDVRSGQRQAEEVPDAAAVPRHGRSADVEARAPDRPVRQRDGASEADREVLRPMFRPLGRSREAGDGETRTGGDNGRGTGTGTAVRRGDDGDSRRGGAEGRQGGGEARPAGGTSREREAAPRQSAPPPQPQAQPQAQPQPQPRREKAAPSQGSSRHRDQ